MKGKFVVCIDDASKEEQDKLTQYLKKADVGYWHWFSDLWLVVDHDNRWSSEFLRDKILEMLPNVSCIVFKIKGDDNWSAFGNKKMYNWLHETWK